MTISGKKKGSTYKKNSTNVCKKIKVFIKNSMNVIYSISPTP